MLVASICMSRLLLVFLAVLLPYLILFTIVLEGGKIGLSEKIEDVIVHNCSILYYISLSQQFYMHNIAGKKSSTSRSPVKCLLWEIWSII